MKQLLVETQPEINSEENKSKAHFCRGRIYEALDEKLEAEEDYQKA